ncbi:unnamed protein product [Cylicostephanus goldi]|uniref:Uncharacterized protein n=1 Tax=Cylicostephanus goldi TaxID=71465 RepID=A0A3P7NL59_CYLGO|nr:unnamed protein product [Cylicostephanus goldi]
MAGNESSCLRLRDVQEALGKRLEEMLALCENLPETVTREELEKLLRADQLAECLSEETLHVSEFKIRSTAHYVFSEAQRVNKFERACERGDLFAMGAIFNESHEAFNQDFERCDNDIDKLVTRCRMSHSYGAHISGWNGMVIALIDDIRPVYLGDKLVYHAFASSGASIEFLYPFYWIINKVFTPIFELIKGDEGDVPTTIIKYYGFVTPVRCVVNLRKQNGSSK